MEITLTTETKAPLRLVTCFLHQKPHTASLDSQLVQLVEKVAASPRFEAKFGNSHLIATEQGDLLLLGLGKAEELDADKVRRAVGRAVRKASKLKIESLALDPASFGSTLPQATLGRTIAEGAELAAYQFDKYKTERTKPVDKVEILSQDRELERGVQQGLILAQATNLARSLVDEPANILTPARLADWAEEAGRQHGFTVIVRDEAGIRALGMEAFLAVARASDNPPRLIVMRYTGNPDSQEVLALVGKGLTYDSGGLSIKPSQGMAGMKGDMAGAAAVLGAMAAISRLKPRVNVVGVIAACENMLSGRAYKPGDIIGSMAGKSIEVLNTDAEGRLTLADAVHYAVAKEKATRVVDIATLTGAAIVALGNVATAVLANDSQFFAILEQAADRAGEKIWRLPHDEEYKELLKSPVADLKNVSSGGAGTITAGLFIEAFTGNKPWLHLDIAGTAWTDKEKDCFAKGATGAGVRTLYYLAEMLAR